MNLLFSCWKRNVPSLGSIPCLLMQWHLKSPVHQQARYWMCRTDNMYCCSRVNFIIEAWWCIYVSVKWFITLVLDFYQFGNILYDVNIDASSEQILTWRIDSDAVHLCAWFMKELTVLIVPVFSCRCKSDLLSGVLHVSRRKTKRKPKMRTTPTLLHVGLAYQKPCFL